MSSVVAYSQVVDAVMQREVWDEAYFSLLSLKAHIQSLPGWQRFDLWATDLDSGEIKSNGGDELGLSRTARTLAEKRGYG